jgi:hypothetical protein
MTLFDLRNGKIMMQNMFSNAVATAGNSLERKLLNYHLNSDFSLNSNWISFLSPNNDSGLHLESETVAGRTHMTTRETAQCC